MDLLNFNDSFEPSSSYVTYPIKERENTIKEEANKTILYIGDIHPNLSCGLFELGYSGLGMNDINKAYSWLKHNLKVTGTAPYALLCDIQFKNDDVKKLTNLLRNDEELKKIPFLFFSSKEFDEDIRKKTFDLGGDDYYTYASDLNAVINRINFLNTFKSREAHIEKNEEKDSFSFESIIKFIFDFTFSITAIIVLSPLFLLIAIAIRLETKGSIFYVSKRVGANYKIFNFYKFRTMKVGADKDLNDLLASRNQYKDNTRINNGSESIVFCKIKNDPRITKVGKFLRKTSLDELPQLFNVVLGDMSIVGNRPLPLYEASSLTQDEIAERFLAPAGITGLWQISKRGKDNMSISERVELDIKYANEKSFLYDMGIILKTFPALIQSENV